MPYMYAQGGAFVSVHACFADVKSLRPFYRDTSLFRQRPAP